MILVPLIFVQPLAVSFEVCWILHLLVENGDDDPQTSREVAQQEEQQEEERQAKHSRVDLKNVPEYATLRLISNFTVHLEKPCDPGHLVEPQNHVEGQFISVLGRLEEVVDWNERCEVEDELAHQEPLGDDLPVLDQLEVFRLERRIEIDDDVSKEEQFRDQVHDIPKRGVNRLSREGNLVGAEDAGEEQSDGHQQIPEGDEPTFRVEKEPGWSLCLEKLLGIDSVDELNRQPSLLRVQWLDAYLLLLARRDARGPDRHH